MTSTTRSSKMLFRLSWAVLCSWSGMETVLYCLNSDLFVAYLISILDVLFLEVAVSSSNSRGPGCLVHHSCSSA